MVALESSVGTASGELFRGSGSDKLGAMRRRQSLHAPKARLIGVFINPDLCVEEI